MLCLPNKVPHQRDDCQGDDALHDGGHNILVSNHAAIEERHTCAGHKGEYITSSL